MTVYLHSTRNKWCYNFRHNLRRYSGYCEDPETGILAANKKQALQTEIKIKARLISVHAPKKSVHRGYTVAQAFAAYASHVVGGRNWRNQIRQIDELLEHFGPDRSIITISDQDIWKYVEWSRQQSVRVWRGGTRKQADLPERGFWKEETRKRSDKTVNRYLAVLRKSLRIAHETKDPVTGLSILPVPPHVPLLREVKRLPNPVPIEAIATVLATLPAQVADAVSLAALTGMRKSELLTRQIQHYRPDLKAMRIDGGDTKGQRDEFIDLNLAAVTIIERRVEAARAAKTTWLFFRGEGAEAAPIKDFMTAWHGALKRCGLPKFRIHDLKATFVTAAYELTKDPFLTQQMARHVSFETTKSYIGLAQNARKDAVDSIGNMMLGFDSIRKVAAAKTTQVTYQSDIRPVGRKLKLVVSD